MKLTTSKADGEAADTSPGIQKDLQRFQAPDTHTRAPAFHKIMNLLRLQASTGVTAALLNKPTVSAEAEANIPAIYMLAAVWCSPLTSDDRQAGRVARLASLACTSFRSRLRKTEARNACVTAS